MAASQTTARPKSRVEAKTKTKTKRQEQQADEFHFSDESASPASSSSPADSSMASTGLPRTRSRAHVYHFQLERNSHLRRSSQLRLSGGLKRASQRRRSRPGAANSRQVRFEPVAHSIELPAHDERDSWPADARARDAAPEASTPTRRQRTGARPSVIELTKGLGSKLGTKVKLRRLVKLRCLNVIAQQVQQSISNSRYAFKSANHAGKRAANIFSSSADHHKTTASYDFCRAQRAPDAMPSANDKPQSASQNEHSQDSDWGSDFDDENSTQCSEVSTLEANDCGQGTFLYRDHSLRGAHASTHELSLSQLVRDTIDNCEKPSKLSSLTRSILDRSDSLSSELSSSGEQLNEFECCFSPEKNSNYDCHLDLDSHCNSNSGPDTTSKKPISDKCAGKSATIKSFLRQSWRDFSKLKLARVKSKLVSVASKHSPTSTPTTANNDNSLNVNSLGLQSDSLNAYHHRLKLGLLEEEAAALHLTNNHQRPVANHQSTAFARSDAGFANHFVTLSNRKWKSCNLRTNIVQFALTNNNTNHIYNTSPFSSGRDLAYLNNSRNFTDDDI